ncbi:MAG TPA: HEAT repeat domain-containing protein [Myxococcota bacterium]|nr:HEAT repeat domain-containing protein [Myxococcota bacterium]
MRRISTFGFCFAAVILTGGCSLFGTQKDEAKPQPPKAQAKPVSAWDQKIGSAGIDAHADRIGAASIGTLAMGGPSSSPKIADYLADPSPKVRAKAIRTLAKFGKKAEPALPKIFGLARNVEAGIRAAALKALVYIGHPAAVDCLERASDDKSPAVRIWALAGLGRLGKDCQDNMEAVAGLLKSTPDEAAEALGLMKCADKDVIERLIDDLGSGDERVSAAAARAIGHIGQPAAAAVPRLMQAMESKSVRVRQAALLALAKMGPLAAAAVPLLTQMLSDPAPRFRELAAHALGSIGAAARSATGDLEHLSLDPEATVQAAAERALAKIRGKGVK